MKEAAHLIVVLISPPVVRFFEITPMVTRSSGASEM